VVLDRSYPEVGTPNVAGGIANCRRWRTKLALKTFKTRTRIKALWNQTFEELGTEAQIENSEKYIKIYFNMRSSLITPALIAQ
jgi:hypothetical protein